MKEGFIFGLMIPVQGVRVATTANNLKSVNDMEDVVREKIKKEVAEGWVGGPFSEPNLRVSPFLSLIHI